MSAGRHARVKELLLAAVDLPASERDAYLAVACDGDASLRAEVEELLALDAVTGDDLLRAAALDASDGPSSELGEGARLEGGRAYRLLELLGEGGMGRVFLAERADGEYRQRVAIKQLAWFVERDSDAARRFRAERQILARLAHPNIARLLDGGTTPEGRPYLVMEHISGRPLTRWADEEGLDIGARLRLFLKVLAAVHFAHQNLVVHRDLKPGNILVTADGEPKLLDFGIAKLLDPELALEAGETRRGDLLLTPRYASPEQVRGEPVSTASDVYSLGVVLYELLTGETPYRGAMSSPAEILRAICDELPTPPSSTAVRKPRSSAADGATERLGPAPGAATAPPPPRIERDLDAIVLNALAKEPRERYGSVEAFAEDLERFLDGRPVAARRGGSGYRLARFARRHRWALAAAALFIATIAGFVIQLARQLDETGRQRDLAQRERDRARASSDFLLDLFAGADPAEARGRELSARDLVDRGAARVASELAAQPELQAMLFDGLGTVYRHLGAPKEAAPLLEKALEIRRRLDREPTEELYFALQHLGLSRYDASRYDEARALLLEALAIHDRVSFTVDIDTSNTESTLAMIDAQRGDFAAATALMEKVVAAKERRHGKDSSEAAIGLLNFAALQFRRGAMAEAERLSARAVEILRAIHHGDHPDLAFALSSLAASTDDNARALPILEESLAMRRRLLGDRHPDVGVSINNLAATLYWMGEYRRAEPLLREALAIWLESYGEKASATAAVRHNLGQALLDGGDPRAARPLLERALDVREARNRSDDPDVALTRTTLGQTLCELGETARGIGLVERGLEVQRRVLAAESQWRVNMSEARLAHCLARAGRDTEARALLDKNLSALRDRLGAAHPFLSAVEGAVPPAR